MAVDREFVYIVLLWGDLGLLWGALGLLWGALGLLWDALGLLWGALGLLLGCPWAPFGFLGKSLGGPSFFFRIWTPLSEEMLLKYRAGRQHQASRNSPGDPGDPGDPPDPGETVAETAAQTPMSTRAGG